MKVYYPENEKCPVIVISWEVAKSTLKSIMLISHMDVAPVNESRWTHNPFDADIDENGNIFARGAQEKCIGMQYLAAIKALKEKEINLQRTIHVTFIPNEQIDGESGMKAFVKSDEFTALNIGFAMNGSCAVPDNTLLVFYTERTHYSEI